MTEKQMWTILTGIFIVLAVLAGIARAEDETAGDKYLETAIEKHELVADSGMSETLLAQACYMREIRDGLLEVMGRKRR